MILRGLNSIYNQANVPKTDSEKSSFAGYIVCWCESTHKHHDVVPIIHNAKAHITGGNLLVSRVRKAGSGIG